MEYHTLHELIEKDPKSKTLYNSFSSDAQVALQEQRQNIHTYEDLKKLACSFEKQKEE